MIRKYIVLPLLLILIILLVVLFLFTPEIFKTLSRTEKVNANILVVEGWLPDNALENAKDEFINNPYDRIITTGNAIFENYLPVYGRGYLTFYLKDLADPNDNSTIHSISVDAFSELEGENCAHFSLYINDSLMGDFFADKKGGNYSVTWEGNIRSIDSVLIHFDNDKWGSWGDRNLYVRKITIDNRIQIPYFVNSRYDYLELDGIDEIIYNFSSYAELAKNKLIALGVDSKSIIAVPGEKTRINRTLKSAKSFMNWLVKSDLHVTGINVVSLGSHSRRTWMIYHKILGKSYKVGIISVPVPNTKYSNLKMITEILREFFGIIYYWLILIPNF